MPGKSETASYVLRSANIPVRRIAGFQACNRFGFHHEAGNWSEPADRNVGDTADRNVCVTNLRDAKLVRASCVAKALHHLLRAGCQTSRPAAGRGGCTCLA